MKEGYIIIKLKVKVDHSEALLTSIIQTIKENIKGITDKLSRYIGISIECVLVEEDQ